MLNGTIEHVAKQSVMYSYMLSQPFAVYVDAYPVLQNDQLLEAGHLQYGQHSEAVRVLQTKLNVLSYYDDNINGEFGILTEHALKKFQRNHNIKVTGQAGKLTLLAIIDEEREQYMKQLTEMTDSIYPGMQGNDVKIVQQSLHYFGFYEGKIDGIYGPRTQKALEAAEKKYGIDLTKEVSSSAISTLYKEEKKQSKQSSTSENNVKSSKENSSNAKEVKVTTPNYSQAIDNAYSLIGTPYVWGGESPAGFDCSGFIQYIFKTQGVIMPRTVSDTWNFTVPAGEPSIGELVFFETYKPGPSHMGIYVGDGKFIHAGASRGVEVSELHHPYWEQRYLGSRKVK